MNQRLVTNVRFDCIAVRMHCPKNNLDLCRKTAPIAEGSYEMVFCIYTVYLAQENGHIYRCIGSLCDRLRFYMPRFDYFGIVWNEYNSYFS